MKTTAVPETDYKDESFIVHEIAATPAIISVAGILVETIFDMPGYLNDELSGFVMRVMSHALDIYSAKEVLSGLEIAIRNCDSDLSDIEVTALVAAACVDDKLTIYNMKGVAEIVDVQKLIIAKHVRAMNASSEPVVAFERDLDVGYLGGCEFSDRRRSFGDSEGFSGLDGAKGRERSNRF